MEAAAAGTANGTVVQQNTCNQANAQVWEFIATDSGHYKDEADTTQGWDVAGGPGATADGAKLQLWRNVVNVDNELRFAA